ncbi:hypothetical protein AK830_g10332 [Neonectria ditissima]|uniref:Uncharacterized protein n=1 Tax=Neonectria ditissima TaxID=78410 RepID=A0A0P7B6R8_9HYPO|nr:hypothetical protein AK830_g10332 [Neonectria ditissima]
MDSSSGKRHRESSTSNAPPVPNKKTKQATSIASTVSSESTVSSTPTVLSTSTGFSTSAAASTSTSCYGGTPVTASLPTLRIEPPKPTFKNVQYDGNTARCASPQPPSPRSQ